LIRKVEIQRFDHDRGEFRSLPLNKVTYNGKTAFIGGEFRILVNKVEIYASWEEEEGGK